MTNQHTGVAHWIDHVVVPTNDMTTWLAWAEDVIGIERTPIGGLTTQARRRNQPIATFLDIGDGSCHFGAFLQTDDLPESAGLGNEYPRYGFFVNAVDLDTHIQRLERLGIAHSAPSSTTTEGFEGAAVRFQDPDGNQWEFWAPAEMPEGAMDVATSLGVGRISSAVYGSRDLQRTAGFFERYFGLGRLDRDDVPEDTLVLPLEAGGRLVYHLTDIVDERVTGHGPWFAMHAAFTVDDDQYMTNYERLWEEVPEEQGTKESLGLSVQDEDLQPARTGLHGSPVGRKWKELYERGDEIYDWDGHAFHFVGGVAIQPSGSLATYRAKEQGAYLAELIATTGDRKTT
jgi:catechol 2,3-dioxygenase-like lactoylglutathione lyase family enzyme